MGYNRYNFGRTTLARKRSYLTLHNRAHEANVAAANTSEPVPVSVAAARTGREVRRLPPAFVRLSVRNGDGTTKRKLCARHCRRCHSHGCACLPVARPAKSCYKQLTNRHCHRRYR